MDKWCVYRHTFSDGRIYIGITSDEPEKRWDNGFGYQNQHKFFREIVPVGWNNITHEIVHTGLDERTARRIEKQLIFEVSARKSLNTHFKSSLTREEKFMLEPIPFYDPATAGAKFMFHGNYDWKWRYEHLRGYRPHFMNVYSDHVLLIFYEGQDDKLSIYEYRIDYTRQISTYDDLYEFLRDVPQGYWFNETHGEMPVIMKQKGACYHGQH